jgi:hypothetical protein
VTRQSGGESPSEPQAALPQQLDVDLTASDSIETESDDSQSRPLVIAHDGYVGSAACLECHADQHASWTASYHRTMTQAVTPEIVAGRFDGKSFEHYGWNFRPERVGDDFYLNIEGITGGKKFRHKLVLATGSHHMQKYWYHAGAGRKMGLAPLVYLIEEDKWVPEHTAFLRPTEEGIPFREGSWNKGCNQCHATGAQPKLVSPDEMNTQVAELGISCEACHGPGETHVADQSADSIVNPRKLEPRRGAQVCGQCHGGWAMINDGGKNWSDTGHVYRPGDDLHQTRHYLRKGDERLMAAVKAENSFWPDGQMRVAGREYNGLIASPCYAHDQTDRQLTCISCHDLHPDITEVDAKQWADDQLGSGMDSNEACYQCHNEFRKNLTAHTKHSASSSGSLCYNCHMPYTSYGLMKAVRSHTITSPTVEDYQVGRPNACNQCHLDQTLAWTADQLHSQYGLPIPELGDEEKQTAASVIWTLKGDAGQRAIMAWSFGWEPAHSTSSTKWMVFYLTDLLFDDYDAIRNIAYKSLKKIDGYESLSFDYMKHESERDRVMDEVMAIWQKSSGPKPTAPRLLFDETGNLRYDAYQFFRAKRDNRKIVITE